MPSPKEPLVKLQFPELSAMVVPSEVTPSKNAIVLPASAVPLNVGVLSLVTLSIWELPVSLAAAKSGVEGADGAAVSLVIMLATEAALMLPLVSVAVAVML